MASIYKHDYEGCGGMLVVDGGSDLERWFDNYKVDRKAVFAGEHETLTIEERKFQAARRRAVRYVGEIVDVNGPIIGPPPRTVLFETNAPAPPTFLRAGKPRPEPKPARAHDSGTLTMDTIFEAMQRLEKQLGMSPEARYKGRSSFREPSAYLHELKLLNYKREERELERTTIRISAINWLTPMLAGDAVYYGLDLAAGPDKTALVPIPPPKRYRRNA